MSAALSQSYRTSGALNAIVRHTRILRVVAGLDFKLKYADSTLGYVRSLVRPVSYFAVLWVVFGRFFKLGDVERFCDRMLLIRAGRLEALGPKDEVLDVYRRTDAVAVG
jgi:ABC-type hemin transport system ATPase subunit